MSKAPWKADPTLVPTYITSQVTFVLIRPTWYTYNLGYKLNRRESNRLRNLTKIHWKPSRIINELYANDFTETSYNTHKE